MLAQILSTLLLASSLNAFSLLNNSEDLSLDRAIVNIPTSIAFVSDPQNDCRCGYIYAQDIFYYEADVGKDDSATLQVGTNDYVNIYYGGEGGGNYAYEDCYVYWNIEGIGFRPVVSINDNIHPNFSSYEVTIFDEENWTIEIQITGTYAYDYWEYNETYDFTVTLDVPRYSFTGYYNHCTASEVEGYNPFPSSSYTSPSNPYGMRFTADAGYYFSATDYGPEYLPVLDHSVVQALAITNSGVSGFEFYPNSREVRSFVYHGDLSSSLDSTLIVTATARATYTLSTDVVNVSANAPSTYLEGQSVSIVLTTSSPYGLQSSPSSVTITGVNEPVIEFSEPIYGTLYAKVTITFYAPSNNVSIRAVGVPYTADYERGYDVGLNDGMTGSNMFEWVKTLFNGMANFFSIAVLPGISLGFLAFAPLLVVAVVAIIRIIRHD